MDELADFLNDDLARVEEEIVGILESDTQLVRQVGDYILSGRGKRLRPIMLLLSARAFNYQGKDHIKVAAALEIIHTATLVHDDVIDKASLRRGKPSVNAEWGDDVAILIADYLYANAFRLALDSLSPVILNTICRVTAQMCEGEMFQIEKRDELLTEADYLHIVRHKTACLFSACTGLGAVIAGAGEVETLEMTKFGLEFGIAFQITDDALDLLAMDSALGKDSGTDIRNGKQTLPLIHALVAASPEEREKFRLDWRMNRDDKDITRFIAKHQGIEYAMGKARFHAENAKTHAEILKAGKAADLCMAIAEYVISRHS
jgi:octaprenyl-diphosphate synthase